jgi:hexosaminidase
MESLKLNVLHLHLADDEGWRIEIPALPQLTANGSSRGYTTDEKDCLYPAYCGGWDKNDKQSTANGYLTREQYVWLLKYAKNRNIRIIPEIDMPGHMRAIKKAMGDVLVDPELEQREYLSAQNYTDNVIAVTRPEALPTMRTIIESFVDMHNEAGCPLTVFNIGGDEVPKGALTREEHQAFIDGVLDILKEYNLQPAGWEEMTHFCKPETRAICYSWHNGFAKAQEMADAGYPVVLATANHLYFDFAYCHQHEEKGLNWGGYTDEFDAFDWTPMEHENVIGLSAQLWAEVIRNVAQVEWQLFPKMFGLSERAWNRHSQLSVAEYGRLVYGEMLPKLVSEEINFHLMQPGIHIEDGKVMINTIYPAGEVHYTIELADNSQVSGIYSAPLELPANALRIKAVWHYLDHTSNTTWLWCE